MRSIAAVGRMLFITALLAAAAIPAEGQFGALRRAASGAAARAAGNGAATAAPATGPAVAAPRFDHETLEITGEVLTRFQAGMGAERRERALIATQRGRLGEFQAQVEQYERCQRREDDRRQAQDDAVDQGQQAQLAARMSQAMMRGDTGTYRRLIDSLTNAQAQRVTASSAACGARPNEAYQTIASVQNPEQRLLDASAEASGFTMRQFAILRERIAPFVLAEGRLPGGGERAYTEPELAALRAALPGLTGFATELRS